MTNSKLILMKTEMKIVSENFTTDEHLSRRFQRYITCHHYEELFIDVYHVSGSRW